jgi:hypothetical protein
MADGDDLSLTIRLGELETQVQAIRVLLGLGETIPEIPQNFIDLADVPSSYSGAAGKSLVVNEDGDGVTFGTIDVEGISEAPEDGLSYLRKNAGWIPFAFEATANQFTILAETPPNINAGWSQLMWKYDTPSRLESGNPSGIRYSLSASYGPYGAGELFAGQPAFTNHVFGQGWNLSTAYTPINQNHGAPNYRIESKFPKASRRPGYTYMFGSEQHWAQHTIGSGGQEWRSISIWQPFENEHWAWDSDISMIASVYAYADGNYVDNSPNIHVTYNWAGGPTDPKPIDMSQYVYTRYASNNFAIHRQYNAAKNAMLPLQYIDNTDHSRISQPIFGTFDIPGDNALGIRSLLSLVATAGMTSGGRMIYAGTNAVTGSVTGLDFNDMSCSTRFEGVRVRNTHASGASGMRIHGNGATYLDFFNEANFHRWGLRLKANGDFTIGQAEQGTDIADALRINFTTLQTTFMKAPKLPSATVTGAGSAATAGAGSIHYVTDLNATTTGSVAAGGGSNSGVVVSDGANWRIMAAW